MWAGGSPKPVTQSGSTPARWWRARPADYGRGGSSYASRYLDRVFKWLRDHPRLTDVAVVGGTAVLSVSLTGELGVVSALALGMAVILLANVLLGRLPSG